MTATTDITSTALLPSCPSWCALSHPFGYESEGDGFEQTYHGRKVAETSHASIDVAQREDRGTATGDRAYGPVLLFLYSAADGDPDAGMTSAQARDLARYLLQAANELDRITGVLS